MGIVRFITGFVKAKNYPGVSMTQLPGGISSLLMDLNSDIHNAAQETYAYGTYEDLKKQELLRSADPKALEDEFFLRITTAITNKVNFVKPEDTLVLAVDGLAPSAKIQQQRQRRYKSALAASEKRQKPVFDVASITPGTDLMLRLDAYLEKWVIDNASILPKNTIYSGHLVPGEGEHKIFDYFRALPNMFNNRRSHVIHGLDADLIMLSLTSPLRIIVMREQHRRIIKQDRRGKNITEVIELVDYISIEYLRDSIQAELQSKTAIPDFILMMFLLGNDFLPHHPGFSDIITATDVLFQIYREQGMPLTKGIDVDFANLSAFLTEVAAYEPGLMQYTSTIQFKFPSRMIEGALPPISNKYEERKLDFDTFRALWYQNALSMKGDIPSNELLLDVFDIQDIELIPPETIIDMCRFYLTGVSWVLRYYYKGYRDVNNLFIYPFHYCPLIVDLAATLNEFKLKKELIEPSGIDMNVFHQLIMALAPYSKSNVPEFLQELYLNSPLADLFPQKFLLEKDGIDSEDYALALVPFADVDRVINTVNTKADEVPSTVLDKYASVLPLVVTSEFHDDKDQTEADFRYHLIVAKKIPASELVSNQPAARSYLRPPRGGYRDDRRGNRREGRGGRGGHQPRVTSSGTIVRDERRGGSYRGGSDRGRGRGGVSDRGGSLQQSSTSSTQRGRGRRTPREAYNPAKVMASILRSTIV